MAKTEINTDWLVVIGRTLAYFCLDHAKKHDPKRVDSVLKKVSFLEDLGLPKDDAAYTAGSSPASVAELRRQQGVKPKRTRANAKKKKRR